MKKLVFLFLVIFLGMSLTGATCMSNIQKVLCSPTPEQRATAASVKQFIASGAVIAGPMVIKTATGLDVTVTYEQAIGALSAVEAGLCVGATDLQLALEWFAAITAVPAKEVLKMAPRKAIPDTGPLWRMVDRQ